MLEKKSIEVEEMTQRQEVPSLVDLCVNLAIEKIRYLGDVGGTESSFLERILPWCTVDQLMHVEKSTKGRDLSPVTDKLWKKFYRQKFGMQNATTVVERMRENDLSFTWLQLYEAKLKEKADIEKKALDRLVERYKILNSRKRSTQVKICTKVPPARSKRSFNGGGPRTGYNVSNVKGNLMKKAKLEFLKSIEVKNVAAMKKNCIIQRSQSAPRPSITKIGGLSGKASGSISTKPRPAGRRF